MMTPFRFLPLAFVLATLPGNPRTVAAQSGTTRSVSAVQHGVRVTLSVPRLTYPRNALVVFTVTVQNVSTRNRYLQDFQPDYGGPYSPHILMRQSSGRLIYEEDLSQFLAPSPSDLGNNDVLRPGQSITRHVRFVLGAGDVQAVTHVADGYTSFSQSRGTPTPPRSMWANVLWHITSPWLHLTLTPEQAPTVAVTRRGNNVRVRVTSPVPVSGPLYFMDSARCWLKGSVMSIEQHVPWTHTGTRVFTSTVTRSCPSAQPYRAVVGWLDHPVTEVSFRTVSAIPVR